MLQEDNWKCWFQVLTPTHLNTEVSGRCFQEVYKEDSVMNWVNKLVKKNKRNPNQNGQFNMFSFRYLVLA